ncbi:hypothetical protein DASB73_009120 [Starmerella bacillaris]|uniref:Peptidase M24 domain-containing protein n=1 Tax=Starmerella bacillaris TaxID=1247836 RepID=A0AAV5RHF7_STABA|nr:hypothetical protein DASB73_009120 [Starmerella bacillaris]
MSAAAEKVDITVANPSVVDKYKVAGDIAQRVLEEIKKLAVPGASVYDLTTKGDELLAAEISKVYNKKDFPKGIAFPTCISVDDTVAYYSPLEGDESVTLAEGSVTKIELGAHIDGFASIVSDTVVVGGAPSQEVKDAIAAAYYATEAALRTMKPGNRTTDVTRIVDLVTKEFGVTALEGMLSMQHVQNNVCGKKRVIINPNDTQRKSHETQKFEENEVYGLDIIISTAGSTGKFKVKQTPTNIFRKTDLTYKLKLRSSRLAISEVIKKAGTFPFNVKILEDQRRSRLALKEPVDHGLVDGYEVDYEREGKPVVQLFTTFAITKNGILKFASPQKPNLEGVKAIENEELKTLLSTSLKASKSKK